MVLCILLEVCTHFLKKLAYASSIAKITQLHTITYSDSLGLEDFQHSDMGCCWTPCSVQTMAQWTLRTCSLRSTALKSEQWRHQGCSEGHHGCPLTPSQAPAWWMSVRAERCMESQGGSRRSDPTEELHCWVLEEVVEWVRRAWGELGPAHPIPSAHTIRSTFRAID